MTTEKSMATLPPCWTLVPALKEESDDHSASWKTLHSNLVVREPQCARSILSIGQKVSYLRRNERLSAGSLLPTLCLGSYTQGIPPRLRQTFAFLGLSAMAGLMHKLAHSPTS